MKGIAIIGVIAIHVTGSSYGYEDTSLTFNTTVIWRQFVNFSVPLFLTISGYFLASKKISDFNNYYSFIKKQIPRVIIPYCLWGILYIGLDLLRGEEINNTIFKFLSFQISTPFYFIFLILQFYLLLPILKKLAKNKGGVIVSALISFLSCLVIFYLRYFTNTHLPIIIYAGLFPTWMVFYVLGMYLKMNKINVKSKILLLFFVISFILSLAETYYIYGLFNDIANSVTAVKISSFLYSISLVLLLFRLREKIISFPPFMVYLGQISFGLYLSHMLILFTLGYLLKPLLPFQVNALFYQFSQILLTVLLGVMVSLLFRKINKNFSVKYLGF